MQKKRNLHLTREIFSLTLGILLIIYSTMNIGISPAPQNLSDIPNQYGKTYCLPIQSISPTSEEGQELIRTKTNNAFILMVLSLVGGIFLVIASLSGLYDHVHY